MDLLGPEFTYMLLILPSLFAGVVVLQGLYKIATKQQGGFVALGFGILFFAAIWGVYYFFLQ